MKNMQKLFALLLAVVMVLSMAVTAFAEDSVAPRSTHTGSAHIIIEGARAGTYYELYRILDVETIPSSGEPVYKVRQEDRVAAEGETLSENYWDTFIEANNKFTLSQDKLYVKATTLRTENEPEMQAFAVEVWEYAQDNGIKPDIVVPIVISGTHTSENPRPYGFYVLRSFHVTATGERVYSEKANVFTLPYKDPETNTYGDLTIKEKNTVVHSIKKEVKEDSLADPANANIGWVQLNAAEIGQQVDFKITVDLAPGTGTYVITDTMPQFEQFTEPEVYYSGGTKLVKGDKYTIGPNDTGDGFVITLQDDFRKIVQDADYLTITYKAVLKETANVGDSPNTNTAVLTHAGEKVGESVSKTHTCQITIQKVDETGKNFLEGATFKIKKADGTYLQFKKQENAEIYTLSATGQTEITTTATGKFEIRGLDTNDKYTLEEIQAPPNYIKMDPVDIQVTSTTQNPCFVETVTVVNLPGVEMPETGGMGTTILYAVGGIMVLAAVVLLVTKKRMSA